MPRDRPSAGGQDSTLDGKFPSEIGGGGGGGGGSARQSPVDTAFVADSLGGQFGGPVQYLNIDLRRFGGTRYGVYSTYGSPTAGYPFRQTYSAASPATTSLPLTSSFSLSVSADYAVGLYNKFTFVSATTSGRFTLPVQIEVSGLSQDFFNTVRSHTADPIVHWTGITSGQGIGLIWDLEMGNPGMNVRYPSQQTRYYGRFPAEPGLILAPQRSPQIHKIDGSATVSVYIDLGGAQGVGFGNYGAPFLLAGFNTTLLDNWVSFSYTL